MLRSINNYSAYEPRQNKSVDSSTIFRTSDGDFTLTSIQEQNNVSASLFSVKNQLDAGVRLTDHSSQFGRASLDERSAVIESVADLPDREIDETIFSTSTSISNDN